MMEDNEKERRRGDRESHDMLIRIDANLSNFMRRFDDHIKEDAAAFEKLNKTQERQNWFIAIGMGIVVAIEFFKEKIFR